MIFCCLLLVTVSYFVILRIFFIRRNFEEFLQSQLRIRGIRGFAKFGAKFWLNSARFRFSRNEYQNVIAFFNNYTPSFRILMLGNTADPHKTQCLLPSPDLQSFLFRWLARVRRSPPMLAAWFWSQSEDSMTSLSSSSTLTRCTPPSSR
jgi:hypothetical protein